MARRNTRLRYFALALYLATYCFATVLGALLLLWGPTPLIRLFRFHTGMTPFYLTPEAILVNLILLLGAPLLVTLGYCLGTRRFSPRVEADGERPTMPPLLIAWGGTSLIAFVSLGRAGAFGLASSWLNYRDWVLARWQLFDTLTFFEFVNIYSLLPVATAMAAVRCASKSGSRTGRAAAVVALCLPMLAIDLLIFQKKTLIISLFLVAAAVGLRLEFQRGFFKSLRPYLGLAAVGAASYLMYCVLVTLPAVMRSTQPMPTLEAAVRVEDSAPLSATGSKEARPAAPEASPRVDAENSPEPADATPAAPAPPPATQVETRPPTPPDEFQIITSRRLRTMLATLLPGRWVGGEPGAELTSPLSRRPSLLASYVVLGALFRAPAPALMYPVVYPKEVRYSGLDAGLDILGLGRMPEDNLYIHRKMWPKIDGGSVMVPFQYAGFSQVGLAGALLLALLVGWGVGRLWSLLLSHPMSIEVRVVGCALLLVFVVFISTDSLRNSLLVSYGLLWALALLIPYWLWSRRGGDKPVTKAGRPTD